MTATVTTGPRTADALRQFAGSGWRERIDVRDFIQATYTPYAGDGSFLTGPTERTRAVWEKVSALFPEERRRGPRRGRRDPLHAAQTGALKVALGAQPRKDLAVPTA